MSMGHIIRRLRKRARLSQKDVAKALGVGQSAVSHWEGGDVLPSMDKIPTLAKVLGVSEQELFREVGNGPTVTGDAAQDEPEHVGGAAEAGSSSPYLRSLEMAVLNAETTRAETLRKLGVATVPLASAGRECTGNPSDDELVGRCVEVPASVLLDHPSAQALIVEGDYMNRVAGDGTIVVYDPDLEPANGRIVVVQTERDGTIIRRWHRGSDKVMLTADSYGRCSDIVVEYDGFQSGPMHVLGTVVHVVTPNSKL